MIKRSRWAKIGLSIILPLLLVFQFALPLPVAATTSETLWAWGNNNSGQLGDGTDTVYSQTPVQVSGLSGVIAFTGGYWHSLALRTDGTVWAWGTNDIGQLGDGTITNRNTPVQVSGLSGVTIIGSGVQASHSLAVKSDGTVWAWGFNDGGQLGDGTTTYRNTPVQVSGLSGVIAIAGGYYHSLALKSDGTVWTWGANWYGQLGDGTTIQRLTPVQVSGLSGITAIAAGAFANLALKTDGTVWTWGANWNGQLGDGTTIQRLTPVQVSGLSGVTAIDGGFYYNLALKSDGTVWAWGLNNFGQLGGGIYGNRLTPVQVRGLSSVTAIAGGGGHSLVMRTPPNSTPILGPIIAPLDPVNIATLVDTSTVFSDPDTGDIHVGTWDWGDGAVSSGTINEATGTVTGSHQYQQAGVYDITLTISDAAGASAQSVYRYVVIYDRTAGFVTGGGWIDSPAGSYSADPSLTGKATFDFVSRYEKGATVPKGNTGFQFKVANLNFNSESYNWLVVAGARAQYKGVGTINGVGTYGFMLTAIDGQISGGGGVDKFRIKIWDKATGNVIYDNQTGNGDDVNPTTAIVGGSIVIHTK